MIFEEMQTVIQETLGVQQELQKSQLELAERQANFSDRITPGPL